MFEMISESLPWLCMMKRGISTPSATTAAMPAMTAQMTRGNADNDCEIRLVKGVASSAVNDSILLSAAFAFPSSAVFAFSLSV